ncbi:hypothetical protein HAPAU_35890 [Halalkalicoccus paucihalophilus]|uniref:Uncharacterized protein n=1 Tax=Halalkalicoccus paucihalophilus TaxID=1008153 RepID=A0A151AA75_9EURY|nr:hypothetical protein HAPAU_35890 [Halalkalicoccus paucihalophilus]
MSTHEDRKETVSPTRSTSTVESRMPNPTRWHETAHLQDGTPISRLGAYWYILNDDGDVISDGYHEIYLNETEDYEGKRSTRREQITLYTKSETA